MQAATTPSDLKDKGGGQAPDSVGWSTCSGIKMRKVLELAVAGFNLLGGEPE
jgi:hypothetical protein